MAESLATSTKDDAAPADAGDVVELQVHLHADQTQGKYHKVFNLISEENVSFNLLLIIVAAESFSCNINFRGQEIPLCRRTSVLMSTWYEVLLVMCIASSVQDGHGRICQNSFCSRGSQNRSSS